MSEEPRQDAAPRRTRRWLIPLTGLALVVTVVAVVLDAKNRETPKDDLGDQAADFFIEAPLPSPTTLERAGTTYQAQQVPAAAVTLDPDDDRLINVLVFDDFSADQPECSSFESSARVVAVDATTVTVATFAYALPRAAGSEDVTCGYVSSPSAMESMYASIPLRLETPLGDRFVVDARTGEVIGILANRRPPVPQYVPRGYRMSLLQAATAAEGFVGVRQYRSDSGWLEILLRSATASSTRGQTMEQTEVAGIEATVWENDYQRCLGWTAEPGIRLEVCSSGDERLSSAELQRIADSMSPLD